MASRSKTKSKRSAPPARADVKVSFIAARRVDGKAVLIFQSKGRMIEIEIDETSDPALGLHEKLKKSKGRDGYGKLMYTRSALHLRSRTNRTLHFAA